MKHKKRGLFAKLVLSLLLLFTVLCTSSCGFDPDAAVDIKADTSCHYEVGNDVTTFYFFYESQERPITDYEIVQITIKYYPDYDTVRKKEKVEFSVAEDVKYDEQTGKPYFTVDVPYEFMEESYVTDVFVLANYTREVGGKTGRGWKTTVAALISVAMLVILSVVYTNMCEVYDSNSTEAGLMWLGGLILYGLAALFVYVYLGKGPGTFLIAGAIVYFLYTLIPYFKYRL